MKTVVVSPSLQYENGVYSHPNYRMLRINPLQGTQSFTLGTSRQQVQMEIPSEVFNFAQSYLQFNLLVPPQAANFTRIFDDTLAPIASINLRTRSGIVLCDIDFLNQYVRIANRIRTRTSVYLSDGDKDCLRPSKTLSNADDAVLPYYPAANTPIPADLSFIEPAYWKTSRDENRAAALNVNNAKFYSVPLSVIAESIFEMDKDLYFGEILVLTLNLAPLSQVGVMGTNANNVATGLAALPTAGGVTATVLDNLAIYLAVEQNALIRKQITDLVQAGKFKMLLPYVHYYYNQRAGAGQQSISLRFNSGHGKNLRSLMHIPVGSAANLAAVYDSYNAPAINANYLNRTAVKIGRFYTTVNNARRQDFDAICDDVTDRSLSGTAWTIIRDHIKGSVAGLNETIYLSNFFILDDFTEFGSAEDISGMKTPKWNLEAGLPLQNEVKCDVIATHNTANQLDYYSFACVSKELSVMPNLVVVT